jgi:hypothetical protein
MLTWLLSLALAGTSVPGTTIHLEPPPGFELAPDFAGFRSVDLRAAILIAELPAEAHAELAALFADSEAAAAGFASKGVTVQRRVTVRADSGERIPLLVGTQTVGDESIDKYVALAHGERSVVLTFQAPPGALSLRAVRATLATLTHAAPPTLEEKVAALPFRFTAPAPLRVVDTTAGVGVWLTVGPLDVDPTLSQPLFILVYQAGAVPTTADGAARTLRAIRGFEEVVIDETSAWLGGTRLTGQVDGRRVIFHLLGQAEGSIIVTTRLPADQADALTPAADALAASIEVR